MMPRDDSKQRMMISKTKTEDLLPHHENKVHAQHKVLKRFKSIKGKAGISQRDQAAIEGQKYLQKCRLNQLHVLRIGLDEFQS